MINDTKKRIEEAKALLPGIKERIIAVGLMLAMSVAMVASSSYAWLTISRSPEAKGMSTTITGNGNLEISLVPLDGSLPGNADGSANDLFSTNITWGNLVNLSDQRYGLDQIALRPSLLSTYNLTTAPLYGATYGADGRVSGTADKYKFASFATAEDGTTYFAATTAANPNYGVRAITSITYANISGNAALNALETRIAEAYSKAEQQYRSLIGTTPGYESNNDSMIIYGEGATAVRAIPALQMLMELYVQEKAKNLLGSYTQDYSGVVTYMYNLMDAFHGILELEGEALTSLANLQIYKTDNALGTGYYSSFEKFYEAYSSNKLHEAVELESLSTFFKSYNDISNVLKDNPNKDDDLYDLAIACDPATVAAADRPAVPWTKLSGHVNKLVDIASVKIRHGADEVTIGSLGGNSISPLMNLAGKAKKDNPATAIISKGALKDTEARLGALLSESRVVVGINVNYMTVGYVYSYVVTDVDPQQLTLSGKDRQTVANMTNAGAGGQGEAIANDTYGMAIDLWVRTNVSDVVLTLEGSLKTVEVTATTINKDGAETTLYEMTSSTTTNGVAYGLTVDGALTYYSDDNGKLVEIGKAGTMLTMLGYTFTPKNTTKVYDGVTYDVYDMTLTQSISTDVYVIEDVERWYMQDGTLLGAADALSGDTRYKFTETTQTITVNNVAVKLYNMEFSDPSTNEHKTGKAYIIAEDIWYQADNHEVIDTDAKLKENGATFEVKMTDVVTGYDGVNRVWEDYLGLIENGFMLENNTTQGSGSCYVFYADPSDQARILHLLEAFTVVFMDQNGNKLGTAKLDTEHYYSINGKTTVPLQMAAGTAYMDEDGNQQYGITALNKNEATWVTAVIYLDGTRLTNADVLSVGEIEGTLNIQFGSSVPLTNQDDPALRFEFRDLTAQATYNGVTSDSSSRPISLDYDENGHEVTVTLKVEGTQPKSIQGFFVRSISKTQGTKGKTESFTFQGNGVWTATFNLTTPGQYVMRSLIVDGAEYTLDDGTENAENGVVVDSFPTVEIDGLGVASVSVSGLNKGITMTADKAVTAEVTVGIDADPSLMPKQVRALFRGQNGEFTAILSNAGDSGFGTTLWKGTADITASGEYSLQYVVMDGVFFDLTEIWEKQAENDPNQGMFTYIIYLGLTTQVWTTGVPVEDENGNIVNSPSFEFTGPENIAFQVKIFDGTGSEVRALDDVWLYYHSEGSILDQDGMYGQINWNPDTGFYEGVLQLVAGGNFVFDRVVTNRNNQNSISTISSAAFSPTITAIVTDPPVYEGNATVQSYAFAPSGDATVQVKLSNAQTATVWALIKDLTSGQTYMVSSGRYDTVGDYQQFSFKIPTVDNTDDGIANPTQDGNWQLLSVYMQNCADSNENWVSRTDNPVEGVDWIRLTDNNGDGIWEIDSDGIMAIDDSTNTVNPADYYVFDLTDASVNGNDPIELYVVQTVYVSVNGQPGRPSNEVRFGNVLYGVDDTDGDGVKDAGEAITGVFLQTHSYSSGTDAITFALTDWKGDPIQLDINIQFTSEYEVNTSGTHGGYTSSYSPPVLEIDLTQGDGKYTLAPQTYQMAGTHKTKFIIKIGDTALPVIQGDTINVYSNAPTVRISGITDSTGNGTFGDTNATVYIKKTSSTWCGTTTVSYSNAPTVKITLAGIGNAKTATLTFTSDSGDGLVHLYTEDKNVNARVDSFTWSGNGDCSRFVGVVPSGSGGSKRTTAGTLTATELVLSDGTYTYTVTITEIIIVNNGQ